MEMTCRAYVFLISVCITYVVSVLLATSEMWVFRIEGGMVIDHMSFIFTDLFDENMIQEFAIFVFIHIRLFPCSYRYCTSKVHQPVVSYVGSFSFFSS
jgi:hypothetical protein